jgi:hypothetical protein
MATIREKMGHLIRAILPKTIKPMLCYLGVPPHIVCNNQTGWVRLAKIPTQSRLRPVLLLDLSLMAIEDAHH